MYQIRLRCTPNIRQPLPLEEVLIMGSNDVGRGAAVTNRTAQSEALFASLLPSSVTPDLCAVTAAIRWAICEYHGISGCAAEMAAAYGKDPETAAARMHWARQVVLSMFPEELR